MLVMILGASGMLGQALVEEGQKRGHRILSDRVELTDRPALVWHLYHHQPDVVINSAALIDLKACEKDPLKAYDINARPVFWLVDYFRTLKNPPKLIQISSDQCDRSANQYAISKATGEQFALKDPNALVVRTNIVGLKNMKWAFESIETDAPMTLFTDYFTASIDVWSCARILFDLVPKSEAKGLLNVVCQDVTSKKEFIEALAAKMGKTLTQVIEGSVKDIQDGVQRATFCGLDVTTAQNLLGYPMPSLDDVVTTLAERRNLCTNPLLSAFG